MMYITVQLLYWVSPVNFICPIIGSRNFWSL